MCGDLRRSFKLFCVLFFFPVTIPETNSSPPKIGFLNRKLVLEASIFHVRAVSFRDV